MRNVVIGLIAAVVAALAVWYGFYAGQEGPANQLGQPLQGTAVTIAQLRENPAAFVGQNVVIEGTLTKECPTSGCWWYVKDDSGEIRADSLGGGFNLPPKQEGRTILTAGKVIKNEGGELELAATGAVLR